MSREKTFMLGVGCQKGGTTWLHNYLNAHPNCDLGYTKEYHVFDALFDRNAEKFYRQRMERASRLLKKRAKKKPTEKSDLDLDQVLAEDLAVASFYVDPENYGAYFSNLFYRSSDALIVGDITPSYSILTAENYRFIRALLERHGFRVKVIFLMRDPVDRCISSVRMFSRDKFGESDKANRPSIDALFQKRSTRRGYARRTRYEKVIKSLERAFDSQDIYYGFYEELFSDGSIREIMKFLELPVVPANFGEKVNASPSDEEISSAALAHTRAFYEDTYAFCMEKFGAERIQALWPLLTAQQDMRLDVTHLHPPAPTPAPDEKVVIAHLGAHKTATSLIQKYFKEKAPYYNEQGVSFISRSDVSPMISWGDAVTEDPSKLNEILVKRSAKVDGPFTFFSNENALGRPFKTRPGLYPDHQAILPGFSKAFESFTPRVVYSIRPPWEFIESYYLQKVHQGYYRTFHQFLEEIDIKKLSWRPIVDNLIAEFGRDHVVIVDFSLIRQGQDLFLSDFIRRAISKDIVPDLDYEKVSNPSISDRGLQLALRINPLLKSDETGMVRRFLQANFSNLTEPRPNLLSSGLKAELMAQYQDEYDALVTAG